MMLARPFSSSLTRRVLNQHLRETNPELVHQQQTNHQNNSDALSDTSSASGNRSSLSRALSRLSGVLGPVELRSASRKDPQPYNRTLSNGELGLASAEQHRRYQRYGRASTLDNIDPAQQHLMSDEESGGGTTPTSYRTYTRTRSREYLSPNSSRGTSPAPSVALPPPDATGLLALNPIVPQLSTVLENGPLGGEAESSPRPARASVASVEQPSAATSPAASGEERKSRRVSRFLRPDFYDQPPAPAETTTAEKQRSVRKSAEQRWDKYNPDEGLVALPKSSAAPVLRPTTTTAGPSGGQTPSSQPLLQARQNLAHVIPVINSPPPSSSNESGAEQSIRKSPSTNGESLPAEKSPNGPKAPSNGDIQPPAQQNGTKSNGTAKSSPKLTVRRQFEHLINLAAAQFQRSQSPGKAPPVAPPPPLPPPSSSSQNAEAISMELKQLEDEIKNTAAIKAQAAAKLDALKYQHALKSGRAVLSPPQQKPAVPAKPDYLARLSAVDMAGPPSIPAEFQPFQYSGTNGVLRELSQQPPPSSGIRPPRDYRDVLSPDRESATNGRPRPFGFDDETIRFARIKRTDQPQGELPGGETDMMLPYVPGTPTDSYESSSVCSDLRGERDSGEDESVSERIFRKSFYTRFNEPGKSSSSSQQPNRRSITNKDLLAIADLLPGSRNASSSNLSSAPPAAASHHHRRSLHRRDESAEAMMVRKFLASNNAEPSVHSERERRVSRVRAALESDGSHHHDRSMSREASVARSVKSDHHQRMTSPAPSDSGSLTGGRPREGRREAYTRSYSSRAFSNDPAATSSSTTPISAAVSEPAYSSASLGRRSYYGGSHPDPSGSLPRRTNRSVAVPKISIFFNFSDGIGRNRRQVQHPGAFGRRKLNVRAGSDAFSGGRSEQLRLVALVALFVHL